MTLADELKRAATARPWQPKGLLDRRQYQRDYYRRTKKLKGVRDVRR